MIVFKQDKTSEIEAWYMGFECSLYQAQCDIFVNPISKYIFDKIVVITDKDYNYTNILRRNNTIISRFPINCDNYVCSPYVISSKFKIDYPFELQTNILTKYSLNNENCIIQNDIMRLKKSYFSCEGAYTKDNYLTQIGWIAGILGIL